MEKIALESLRLIAADYVSQQVIDELRSEGIYSIKKRIAQMYMLMSCWCLPTKEPITLMKS